MTIRIVRYILSVPLRAILTIGTAAAWTLGETKVGDFGKCWKEGA